MDEIYEIHCKDCEEWDPCPCGECEWGRCTHYDEWMPSDEGCER